MELSFPIANSHAPLQPMSSRASTHSGCLLVCHVASYTTVGPTTLVDSATLCP